MIQQYQKIKQILDNPDAIIGVTSGVFDLLHPTHVMYLERCKRHCDYLIVLIDSDDLSFIRKNKYPIINQIDRGYMLSSLECVDDVQVVDTVADIFIYCNVVMEDINNKKLFFRNHTHMKKVEMEVPNGFELRIIRDLDFLTSTTQILNKIRS